MLIKSAEIFNILSIGNIKISFDDTGLKLIDGWNYDDDSATEQELKSIKDYYLKKRYLLRIRENLDKFASL